MIDWAVTLIYPALAGCVTLLSWRTPLRIIALSLIAACLLSIAAAWTGSTLPQRAIVEILLSLLITTASLEAWTHRGGFAAKLAVAFSFADTCFAGSVCLFQSDSDTTKHIFDIVTNMIFVAQCLCAGTPGARNAIGSVVGRWRIPVGLRGDMDAYRLGDDQDHR